MRYIQYNIQIGIDKVLKAEYDLWTEGAKGYQLIVRIFLFFFWLIKTRFFFDKSDWWFFKDVKQFHFYVLSDIVSFKV